MDIELRSRFSPSLVISVIALIVAVAGSTFAIASGGLSKKKVNKIVSKRAPVFAQIAADGTVVAANSRGITQANVAPGSFPGYYCFSKLPFVPRSGQATIDWNGTVLDTIALIGLVAPPPPACPAGTQVFVDTRHSTGTGSVPAEFLIALYH